MTAKASTTPSEPLRESSRVGVNVIALIGSRFLCLALSLVQTSIILRALGVEGSGQFIYALNFPALFTMFATLGIQRLLVRDIAREPGIAWTYAWTAALVTAVLSALVLAVVAGSILAIEADTTVRWAVVMSSLSVVVLWALQGPFEAILIARERMIWIAVIYVIAGVARLAAVYLAMRLVPSSVSAHTGIAVGGLLGFFLCVAVAIWVVGWERPRFRLSLALAQIRECMPFTAAMLFSAIYFKSDVSILTWLCGKDAAGIYGPAQRIMEPLLMIAGIWGTAVFPALCRLSVNARENYDRLAATSARLALMIAFPMAFGVAAIAQPVIALLTGAHAAEFGEAVFVLRVFCAVVPFFYLNSIGQEFLYATHRTWLVPRAYGVAAVLSVVLNLLLIPRYGVPAVAYTALLVNAAISVIFVAAMPTEYRAMALPALVLKTLVACLLMATVAYLLVPISLAASIAAGGLIYVVMQALLKTLVPEERVLVARLAQAPLKWVWRRT